MVHIKIQSCRCDGTYSALRVEDMEARGSLKDIIDVDGTLYFIAYNGSSYSLFNVNNAGNSIIGAPTVVNFTINFTKRSNFQQWRNQWNTNSSATTPIMYPITASNANGSSSTHVNLVIDAAPGTFCLQSSGYGFDTQSDCRPFMRICSTGGAVTSWEIKPDLPAGLNFESSNGTIWGTQLSCKSIQLYILFGLITQAAQLRLMSILLSTMLLLISSIIPTGLLWTRVRGCREGK